MSCIYGRGGHIAVSGVGIRYRDDDRVGHVRNEKAYIPAFKMNMIIKRQSKSLEGGLTIYRPIKALVALCIQGRGWSTGSTA